MANYQASMKGFWVITYGVKPLNILLSSKESLYLSLARVNRREAKTNSRRILRLWTTGMNFAPVQFRVCWGIRHIEGE
jgi:hypothetical protein